MLRWDMTKSLGLHSETRKLEALRIWEYLKQRDPKIPERYNEMTRRLWGCIDNLLGKTHICKQLEDVKQRACKSAKWLPALR